MLSVVLLAGVGVWLRRAAAAQRLHVELLRSLPDAVLARQDLVSLAVAEARPLFAQHCAVCHGPTMHGRPAIGAPNLTDSVWLYGTGTVFDIERTILYGVRSSMSKGHHVTEMPAFGSTGILTPAQIRDVVQYLLKLCHRPHDGQAALAGEQLYYGAPNCGDCHGPDARGDSDYGSPDLTANVWNSGSDPDSLYRAIYYGEHRIMPAWYGTLSLEQIRALAVYIHVMSHPPAPSPPEAPNAGAHAG